MSPAVRALGRELHGGPEPRRTGLSGFVLRHLPELAAAGLLVWAWRVVSGRLGAGWAGLAGALLVTAALSWPRSRRCLAGLVWCAVTRSRLRAALIELRLCRRDGRPPRVLAVLPTAAGERAWLLCPVRVAAEDIAEEADRLRAACFAAAVRVRAGRRLAAVVRVDVVRREPPVRPVEVLPARRPAVLAARAPAGGGVEVA